MYKTLGMELGGTTPNMRTVRLNDGRRGVAKPWNEYEYNAEQTYFKIAKFFGLEVSPCVKLESEFVSIISYNSRLQQVHCYDLPCHFDLQSMCEYVGGWARDILCLVMFVDAVCNNTDRHSGNLAMLRGASGKIVGVCPPYDNCATFSLSFGRQALLGVSSDRATTHCEVFRYLSVNWELFGRFLERFVSDAFLDEVSDSVYFDWIVEQRRYLLSKCAANGELDND